jgi:alpha-galactosidase
VVEQGRYHLDFSHPAAREHLDRVIDFLVGELGAGYLKMDYNINIGPGTDRDGASAGAGLLAHNRAFLQWLDALLDRYEGLTVESCSSGGMRKDYALLSRCQLQSTSDQQDFLRYPPIAAAVPMAVAPEQAAVWAYPQPGWRDNEITFTLCSALLGRVHLSGHLDKMDEHERRLVAEGVAAYKQLRQALAGAVPFWPLGLPRWEDHWFALGMRATGATYISVWHRGALGLGHQEEEPSRVSLPVAHLKNANVAAAVLYPAAGSAQVAWHPEEASLHVTLPEVPSACLVTLR